MEQRILRQITASGIEVEINIQAGQKYAVQATTELQIVEVQLSEITAGDEVTRLEWIWN